MRISGLSSGIDWEGMIQQLMKLEQRPVLLLQQEKLGLEQEKTAWRDVNTRLLNLKSKSEILETATFSTKKAVSTDETVLTATAGTSAGVGTYEVVITQLAAGHVLRSDQYADVDADLGLSGTFQIDASGGADPAVEVTIEATDSLTEIKQKINDAGAGVSAAIIDGYLVLTRSQTGATAIAFADSDNAPGAGVLTQLGILNSDDSAIAHELVQPRDAVFTVNNLQIQRSGNAVSDVIAGVTLNLKAGAGATVTLTVSQDTQAIANKITDFVNQYNSVMDLIATELSKDDKGRLVGDPSLMNLERDLREKVSDRVVSLSGGIYDRLSAIGITTTNDKTARLAIDTAKLAAALNDDPAAVESLFTASGGIAARVTDKLDYLIKSGGAIDIKSNSLTDRIDDFADQIERLQARLEKREQTLYNTYAALEKLLSTLETQGAWLSQQLNLLSRNWKTD